MEIAAVLDKKGIQLLDAPVSGGQIGAIEGKLSIMVGGPKEALEKVRPILEVYGPHGYALRAGRLWPDDEVS